MYKTEEAIINIEVKTSLITNPDYRGKVQLGRNQISYGTSRFKPNLPTFYESVNLPNLKYVIQIVHEHLRPKINALNVICVPNGQLFNFYGEEILSAGKAGWEKARDIRYNYSKQPYFVMLKEKYSEDIFRIEILLLDKNMSIEELTGKPLPLAPFKRI